MTVKDLKEILERMINELRNDINELKNNEIAHLQTDVKELQKFRWRTSGVVNGILTFINLIIALSLILSKIF